jgi:Ca-activated chloride channel family protein
MSATARSAAFGLLAAILFPAQLLAAEIKLDAEPGHTVLSSTDAGNIYLRLSLKSLAGAKREHRTPINAAIVIDRSGSMAGDRLSAAKEGARVGIDRLSSDDTVALVAYNHSVDVLSPAAPLRGSSDTLKRAIDRLTADGTTALYDGVKEGGRQVEEFLSDKKVNRVVLLSDGLANVGPSSPDELAKLGRTLASKGITVSTIGLGLDYNEDLMQRLAAASDGNHVFVERPSDLKEIFDREFGDALSVSARDITITIECKLGFEPIRILGRDGTISGNRITVKLNQLQADNERYIVVELKAPQSHAEGSAQIADVRVDYTDLDNGGTQAHVEARTEVRFSKSTKDVEDGVNKPVMSQVAAQIATETSEKAVLLRDKGDTAGARKVLEDNASYIKRSLDSFGSGPGAAPAPSVKALNALEQQSREAASNLDDDNWNRTRKTMRSDQHRAKVQQAY